MELSGERIEIVTAIPGSGAEIQHVKDVVRDEYKRRGYIPADLASFEDEFDEASIYFGTYVNGDLLAAARLIEAEKLPTRYMYYEFRMPEPLEHCPKDKLREVSRLTVLKRPGRNPLPRHFASTMTISGLIDYGFSIGLCGGVSTIKVSFLRLFERLNLPALHEIPDARLIYPRDGLLAGFFYDEAHPAVPIHYKHDEAKAIFDGLFHVVSRTGRTLLDESVKVISHEVLV